MLNIRRPGTGTFSQYVRCLKKYSRNVQLIVPSAEKYRALNAENQLFYEFLFSSLIRVLNL